MYLVHFHTRFLVSASEKLAFQSRRVLLSLFNFVSEAIALPKAGLSFTVVPTLDESYHTDTIT